MGKVAEETYDLWRRFFPCPDKVHQCAGRSVEINGKGVEMKIATNLLPGDFPFP